MAIVTTAEALQHAPATIHLLITTRCNLNCEKCFYRKETKLDLPSLKIKELFTDWSRRGVRAVAIGGGEPFIHPDISEIIAHGKRCGLYVSVTTNGTIRPTLTALPDRVHVSCDSIHPTTTSQVTDAIAYFKQIGVPKVGINHIVTDMQRLRKVLELDCDNVTVLIEKPQSSFTKWRELAELVNAYKDKVWLDACMAKLLNGLRLSSFPVPCQQGVYSMSVDSFMHVSKCSNLKQSILYADLENAWAQVRAGCGVCVNFGMDSSASDSRCK